MVSSVNAQKLADYIKGLPGFEFKEEMPRYNHLGATLTDAMFQAGVNYNACVLPRVNKIRAEASASTISGLKTFFKQHDAEQYFAWKGRKPRNLLSLIKFLDRHFVETEDDLKKWLNLPGSAARLKEQPGFGDKTVDYLKILVGFPSVAVDRHILTMLERAGICKADYAEAKEIVMRASEILGVNASVLDHSIWNYISNNSATSANEGFLNKENLEQQLLLFTRRLPDDDLRKIIAQVKALTEL